MSSTTPRPRRRGFRRLTAALAALVAGSALALGSVAPAQAAQNVDPNAIGSITVHKFQEPTTPTGLKNDGTQVDTAGLTPLAGVTFSVQQVNLDLKNPDNWQNLDQRTVAWAQGNLTGTATSLQTNAQGTAAFGNLPVGLYLVTETDTGNNNVAFKGQPFLVSIPLAQPNNDWLYNVHVYPKNTVTGLTKAVDDSSAHVLGDKVTYTLTAQIPSLPADQPFTAFGITDALDSRLKYDSATVQIDGADASQNFTVGANGQNFSAVANSAGLTALRANQGKTVTVTLTATVQSIGDGTIENTAKIYVNDPAKAFDSNEVTTSWGALKVLKYAANDKTQVLSGAEFNVYATDAQGNQTGSPLVIAGNPVITTGADGTVLVEGLKEGKYFLVETKAPTGYQLDKTPIAVQVKAGAVTAPVEADVANKQTPAFMLPLTGSTGITLFIGIGVALVAAGLLIAALRRRSARAAQARSAAARSAQA